MRDLAKFFSEVLNITGIVTDASSGGPIAGATVNAGRIRVNTGTTGQYKINIAPGAYGVSASALNFLSSGASVTVASGATVTQDFALMQIVPGTIKGKVTTLKNIAIKNATIRAGIFETTTDSAGDYRLNVPSPGSYDVYAYAAGYKNRAHNAKVPVGQETTLDFVMAKDTVRLEEGIAEVGGQRICTMGNPVNRVNKGEYTAHDSEKKG